MVHTEAGACTVLDVSGGSRRTRSRVVVAAGVGLVVVVAVVAVVLARPGNDPARFLPPKTVEDKVASAMLAGPASIAAAATVLDWKVDPADPYPVLRKGTNDWTCFPDWVVTPAEDPACLDVNSMAWLDSYYAGTKPKLAADGISYWLRGSSDASWSDPAVLTPPPGQDWAWDGPHITIVPVNPSEVKGTGPGAHHEPGRPMAMWAGTPYAHWHVPLP